MNKGLPLGAIDTKKKKKKKKKKFPFWDIGVDLPVE